MKKCAVLLGGILVILWGIPSLSGAAVPLVPDFPGWEREIPEGDHLAQLSLPGEDGKTKAAFFLSRMEYPNEEEAGAFEETLKEAPLGEGNIKILDVQQDTFRDRLWIVHHLLGEIPGAEGEDPEVFEVQKFFSREGKDIYSFEFISYPKYFEELRPHFAECMALISFEEEEKAPGAPAQTVSEIPTASEEDDEFVGKLTSKKPSSEVPKMPAQEPSPASQAPLGLPPQPSVQVPPVLPAAPAPGLPAASPGTSSILPPASPAAPAPASPMVPQGFGAAVPPPAAPSRLDLEISPGPEWTPTPPLDPSISRYYLLAQQGINMAEMMVFEEDFDAPTTLQSYAQIILSQAPQLFAGYGVGQNWDTVINGVSMKVHEFFFSAQGNPNRLIGRAYVFLGGPQRGYVVLFDTTDQSYPYLAPKFDAVMRTLNLPSGTPAPSLGQPSQPLPGTGGLPSFGASSDPGTYQDPAKGLRVPLPSGARLTEQLPQGGRYALADGVELVLLNLGSSQEMESLAAQVAQGKTFQGESLVQARGTSGQAGLYASVHPQTSVPYATLVARYPQASLLMILTLPRENYQRAGVWMLPFLESVSLGR